MDKNEMIHTITIQYFVIYTLSMFATILFCHIDQPQIKMLSVSYLGEVAVFSFLACLPTTIYYSKSQNVLVKTILHTILLETILLIAGYQIGMYEDVLGGLLFFFTILVVDILVRLFLRALTQCQWGLMLKDKKSYSCKEVAEWLTSEGYSVTVTDVKNAVRAKIPQMKFSSVTPRMKSLMDIIARKYPTFCLPV